MQRGVFMFHKPTIAELEEELHQLTDDLLIDLFLCDLLVHYPADPAADNHTFLAAVSRTGCFLKQHSTDLSAAGRFLLERAKEHAASA